MGVNKQFVFTIFFNHRDEKGKDWAQRRRSETLAYLTRLFENKAKFACIAREESRTALILTGYVNLHSPCTLGYAKKLLGKYGSIKPSYFGDLVSLCRLVHIDRKLKEDKRELRI